MQRTPRNAGYTLVELVVVLVIVVLLVGLVIVRVPYASSRQLAISSARKIGHLIENARDRAIAEEAQYALRIELNTGRYQVVRPTGSGAAELNRAKIVQEGMLETPITFAAVRAGSKSLPNPVVFVFSPKSVMPASEIDIAIDRQSAVTLQIHPAWNEVSYLEH